MDTLLKFKISSKIEEIKERIEYYEKVNEKHCKNKPKAIEKVIDKLVDFNKKVKSKDFDGAFTMEEDIRYTIAFIRKRYKEQTATYVDMKAWKELAYKYKWLNQYTFERIAIEGTILHVDVDFKIVL